MQYEKLKVISFNSQQNVEEEYAKRLNYPTTFKTNLIIIPYSVQKEERVIQERYPLFHMPLPEILMLEDRILRNSKEIQKILVELPPIAQDKMLFNQIIEEIQSTNEIEGVRSTRKELQEAAKYKDSHKEVRFKGIVSQYLNISDSKYEKIEKVEDYRSIYDTLFVNDIQEEGLPDGKLFRKDTVYVEGKNKIVLQGAPNEELIVKDLEVLIHFMNSESYPFLLKAAITHYFFEYIHPFYDGNGRLGRFILSSYLARKVDKFTGVSFSYAVRENRKKYLDAFIEVSDPKNKGDITHFVQTIYELVIEGQEKFIEELLELQFRYEHAKRYMQNSDSITDEEKKIVFYYIQNYLFDSFNDVEDRNIAEMIKVTMPTLNKRIKPLVEKGIIEQIKQRPSIHTLSDQFIDRIEGY